MVQKKTIGQEKFGHVQSIFYQRCTFKLSSLWYRYSIILLVLITPFLCFVNFMRFYSGSSISKKSEAEWYLANVSYIINDINSWLMIFYGMRNASKTANILTKSFMLPIRLDDCKLLLRRIYMNLAYLIIGFFILICSFSYVTILRMKKNAFELRLETIIENGPGVIYRGLAIITSTAEGIVIMILSLIVVSKLQLLSQSTEKLLTSALKLSRNQRTPSPSKRPMRYSNNNNNSIRLYNGKHPDSDAKSTTDFDYQMECLSDMHRDLTELISDVNEAVSPLLLVDLGTCLYIAIFYLFRLCVTSLSNTLSNNEEIMHYVVSAFYRIGKLIMYMILGHLIVDQYKQPLRLLNKTNLFCLPSNYQKQLQMLIVQWSINLEGGYLNATHIVYVGPWLLASMIGNIITYLLVALQFQKK